VKAMMRQAITLAVLILCVSCAKLRPSAEDHYERAEQYLSHSQYEQAAIELRRALDLKPVYPEAHFRLGWVLFHGLEDVKAGITEYQMAIAQGYSHPGIHYELGLALSEAELYDEALAEFQKAISKGYNTPQVHLECGRAWLGKDKLENAEKEFQQAIALNQPVEFPLAHYFLGEVYERQGKIPQAVLALETYVQLMAAQQETLEPEATEGPEFSFNPPVPVQEMPDIESVKARIKALKERSPGHQ